MANLGEVPLLTVHQHSSSMDYFWPCLIFAWIMYIFDLYLSRRQHKLVLATEKLPRELDGVFDTETYAKSRAYQIDKHGYSFWHGLYHMAHLTFILSLNVMPLTWNWAGQLLHHFGMGPEYEITHSIVFVTLLQFYQDVLELPWTVYCTFVLEQKHGFNNQTVGFFVKDQIKGVLVKYTLMAVILSGIVFFINWGGDYFFIYTWAFICVTTIVVMTIYPTWIAPIFDTYTPLPDGSLKTAIEELASSLQYPLKKIFVVDGSKRSSHSNAYMYGFYKNKRIVLFDTLLELGLVPELDAAGEKKAGESPEKREGTGEGVEKKEEEGENVDGKEEGEGEEGDVMQKEGEAAERKEEERRETVKEEEGGSDGDKAEAEKETKLDAKQEKRKKQGCNQEEVIAVLAHELGHWQYSHVLKNLFIIQLDFLISLYLFSFLLKQSDVYTSFGFDTQPTLIGLIIVFQFIFSPFNTVIHYCMIQLSRRYEYQADAFALMLGKGKTLKAALTKLFKDNLSFPIADPLYSALTHSHPTFLERARALDAGAKKRE